MVSTEYIYQFIYKHKTKRRQLYHHLRIWVKKCKKWTSIKNRKAQIPDKVGVEQRPAIVHNKKLFLDWEGDTIIGKGHHHRGIIILVGNKNKFIVNTKPDGKKPDSSWKEIINALTPFKEQFRTNSRQRIGDYKELKKA